MGIEIFLYLLVFLIFLGLSAFFSGSETAYFSLSQSTIEQFRTSDGRAEQRVARLMENPHQFLITIVIGNTIVNITIASIAALVTDNIIRTAGLDQQTFYGINGAAIALLIDVLAVTLVLLISSEILPKVVAIRKPMAFANKTSGPLTIFHTLVTWISKPLAIFSGWLQRLVGLSRERSILTEGELKALVEVGAEHGTLELDEKEMIDSIFEFGETTVKEIMIPRTDMVCLDSTSTLSQVMETVRDRPLSRIPVFKNRIDNIIGLLYVKDLIPLLHKRTSGRFSLQRIVRSAYFVPEQKRIHELLREFQQERMHMALVVDEYGGVSGLVTLEDIIEEIVGEIQDEYDREPPLFRKVDDATMIVDGRMGLEEINDEFNLNLPTEEGVETISGFILSLLGSLPKENEQTRFNGYTFTVEEIEKNRILKVRITRDIAENTQ